MFKNIHHHPTFFPVMLALLTGGLIYFMFFAFTSKPIVLSAATTVVDEGAYRESVKNIVAPFLKSFSSAPNDMAKLVLTENVLNTLLNVTVPVIYKEIHLELAISLNQMRDGLRGANGSFEDGKVRFERIVGANPWLK